MDLQPWDFGHGSSAMDLEKMNIKFKTQKIWIQTQIGQNTKLKTIFQTPTPPKHQIQKSNPYFWPPNTKSKPKFSAPKHKTQNPNFPIFRETKQKTSNPNLRAKTKPLATSDSKLSNPNGINLRLAKTESTSDLLLSSFACLLGV